MKVGDRVIVSDYGIKVEGIICDTRSYSAYPGMAGQEGTMYLVQSDEWFGRKVWLTEDKISEVKEDDDE